MDPGFRGDVASYYARFRRGYPAPVVSSLVAAFDLTPDDVVVDLGCGTGQLTVPLAGHVRAVAGVDPSPDMLGEARRLATAPPNVTWIAGADTDVPALTALLGPGSVRAVTIAQALHWMDPAPLFRAVASLVRPGGGIAVLTNGTPLWLQDSPWSRALRDFMASWLGTTPTRTCGTDDTSRRRYRDLLTAAGYTVHDLRHDYTAELDAESIVGHVCSALPVDRLPADRAAFAHALTRTLLPHRPFTEPVTVHTLVSRR